LQFQVTVLLQATFPRWFRPRRNPTNTERKLPRQGIDGFFFCCSAAKQRVKMKRQVPSSDKKENSPQFFLDWKEPGQRNPMEWLHPPSHHAPHRPTCLNCSLHVFSHICVIFPPRSFLCMNPNLIYKYPKNLNGMKKFDRSFSI
jgi:hypothetical protein